MSKWIASNHANHDGLAVWHAAVETVRYTDRTRKPVGLSRRTRCSGRQLGGAWGMSVTTEGVAVTSNNCCLRCVALVKKDRAAFRAKARAWFTPR